MSASSKLSAASIPRATSSAVVGCEQAGVVGGKAAATIRLAAAAIKLTAAVTKLTAAARRLAAAARRMMAARRLAAARRLVAARLVAAPGGCRREKADGGKR